MKLHYTNALNLALKRLYLITLFKYRILLGSTRTFKNVFLLFGILQRRDKVVKVLYLCIPSACSEQQLHIPVGIILQVGY